MTSDKFLSFLGLCRKAGKIIFGYDRCEKEIYYERILLVLIANDFSEKAKIKLKRLCNDENVECVEIPYSIDELYYTLSYKAGVLGITDSGFVKKIKSLLQSRVKEENAL